MRQDGAALHRRGRAIRRQLRRRGGARAEDARKPLRFCADPTNLPFSSSAPGEPGLHVEFGRVLARGMDRAEPVWTLSHFGKRAARTKMPAGTCDAPIGLRQAPGFLGPKIIFSRPLLDMGYALVTPKDARIGGLDNLRGKRVAARFSFSPPATTSGR